MTLFSGSTRQNEACCQVRASMLVNRTISDEGREVKYGLNDANRRIQVKERRRNMVMVSQKKKKEKKNEGTATSCKVQDTCKSCRKSSNASDSTS